MWPFSKKPKEEITPKTKPEPKPEPKYKVGQWVLGGYTYLSGIEIIEASYHSRWTYTVKGYNSEYSFHCDEEDIHGVIDAPPSEIKKEWCAVLIHGGSEKTNVMVDFQTTNLGSYFYGFKSVTHPILKTFETEEEALDYLIENGEEICKIISINKCLSSHVLAEKIRRTLLKDN